MNVRDGELVENTCMFESDMRDPVIEWYNQNGELLENSDRIRFDNQLTSRLQSTIRINGVHRQDVGRYECRVRDSQYSVTFDLNVEENCKA